MKIGKVPMDPAGTKGAALRQSLDIKDGERLVESEVWRKNGNREVTP